MPDRIFKYADTTTLIAGVTELGQMLTSGSGTTNALKNSSSGFLVETGAISQSQLTEKFRLGRWEIYLRGQGVDGNAPDQNCALLEPCDPMRERRMHVQSSFQKWPGGINGWWNQF